MRPGDMAVRATPVGAPIAPVIKVASNSDLWRRMGGDLDIDAGEIADGTCTLEGMGQQLWGYLMDVLSGKPTQAEQNRQEVFALSMTMEAF